MYVGKACDDDANSLYFLCLVILPNISYLEWKSKLEIMMKEQYNITRQVFIFHMIIPCMYVCILLFFIKDFNNRPLFGSETSF